MASKEIQRAQRHIEAAVARRWPNLSKADQSRVVAHILDQVAHTLDNGSQLTSWTQLENGEAELEFLTVEKITQQVLSEGSVGS